MYVLANQQDATDYVQGHGTHTAGTIAGATFGFNATQKPDYATGIAPGVSHGSRSDAAGAHD